MRVTLVTTIVLTAAVLGGVPLIGAEDKPSRVLATLTYTIPANVKVGDEVTTTLRLTANQNIDRLLITVYQRAGLTILSQPYEATFTDVSRGTSREFEVRIRLDDQAGALQVQYQTVSKAFGAASETRVISYSERQ